MTASEPTQAQKEFGVKLIMAVTEAIREVKRIPSGHLYAILMGKMSIDTYNQLITIIKRTGLVKEEGHELIWVEPTK
jgi:hypothetical protein